MGNWKLVETKIRHRDSDPIRQKHLEQIAELEWRLADSGDAELLKEIKLLYMQLEIYDEMEGYK